MPVVKLLWLKPHPAPSWNRKGIKSPKSEEGGEGAKLPCAASPAGIQTGDLREGRWSVHACDLRVREQCASSVRSGQALLQLLPKESNLEDV